MRLLNLPGAPLLLPRVGGRTDPAAALREVCRRAVDEVWDDSIRRVIILAPGDRTATWPAELPAPIGQLTGSATDGPTLPLPLAVGRELLLHRLQDPGSPELILQTVAADGGTSVTDDGESDTDLIIAVADGSALSRPGGPAAVHPQAEDFDRRLVQAWRSGDPSALGRLDSTVAAEVLATGGPVWHQLAGIAGRTGYRSKINFADAPFGVFYLVASWT